MFCLREYDIPILVKPYTYTSKAFNLETPPPPPPPRYFAYFGIEQKVICNRKDFIVTDKQCNSLDNRSKDNTETTLRIPISLSKDFLTS